MATTRKAPSRVKKSGAAKAAKKPAKTKPAAKAKKPAKDKTGTSEKPAKKRAKKVDRPPRPVKEPTPIKGARQQPLRNPETGESIKGPEDRDLDDLVNDAYDKSLTFTKAQKDMNAARDLAFARMKKLGINVHETEDGVEARITRVEEKLKLKREKKTVEYEEPDSGDVSDGKGASVTEADDDD